MIKVQRSAERRYVRDGAMKMWKTFDPANLANPFHMGFRALESLNEVNLPVGTGFKLALGEDHEVVTYVRKGGLLVRNRPLNDQLLGPGWYQRTNSHPWTITRVPKTSPSHGTQLFLSSIRADPHELKASYEHKHFPFADQHGRLRLVASPHGEAGSLQIRQDVRLYSSLLEKGHHIVHELQVGRGAWLHVVAGRIRLIDQSLETGDGASLEDEAAVSFTAQEASEILLFDLA
jgi:redox-sensitive bicupin YhaK (pirin superfamily)